MSLAHFGRVMRGAASRVASDLRHLRDSMLHSWRRDSASRRIRRLGQLRRILILCHGNICRSPYLEAALRRALPDMEISSAGFVGPGRGVPAHSLTVGSQRGLDLASHRSRVVTPQILRGVDLVIVMDARQADHLNRHFRYPRRRLVIAGDLDSSFYGTRSIRDPWGEPLDVFEASFARLDTIAKALIALVPR